MPSEQEIFAKALAFDVPADRTRFLEHACGEDFALRARIEAELNRAFYQAPRTDSDDNIVFCPRCGQNIKGAVLGECCPTCALKMGVDQRQNKSIDYTRTFPSPVGQGFNAPDPHGLSPLFPQLEIIQLLGSGGMGAVYLARQKSLDRLVALKIIRPDTASMPSFPERFSREAKSLARLSHSNIVAIYDFGSVDLPLRAGIEPEADSDRMFYLLMEYVDGTNLRGLIQAKSIAPREALAIVPQICDALQFAHDQGIVHRDIKPENILIDRRGRIKIADFGLAKLMSQESREFTLTGTHQVMGTPRYMAPEQLEQSRNIDHRADIYSLGVVFYELLTGELPLGAFEPPSRKVQVDVRLDEVVLRSLAKEPERRYQHASEVKTDIESIGYQDLANIRPDTKETQLLKHEGSESYEIENSAFLMGIMGVWYGLCLPFSGYQWARTDGANIVSWIEPRNLGAITMVFFALPGLSMFVAAFGMYNKNNLWLAWIGVLFSFVGAILSFWLSNLSAVLVGIPGSFVGAWALSVLIRKPFIVNERADKDGGPKRTPSYPVVVLLIFVALSLLTVLFYSPTNPLFYFVVGVIAIIYVWRSHVLEGRTNRAAALRAHKPASPTPPQLIGRVSKVITILAWLSIPIVVGTLVVILAGIWGIQATVQNNSSMWQTIMVLVLVFYGMPVASAITIPIVLIAASRMRSLQSYGLAIAGAVLFLIPVNIVAFAGIPIGVWGLIVLMRADVREAFAQASVPIERTQEQLGIAGTWLLISGVASILGSIAGPVALLFALMSDKELYAYDNEIISALFVTSIVGGLLASCQIWGATNLRGQRSYRWSVASAIIALINLNPGWLVGLPAGIYALAVLGQRTNGVKSNKDLFAKFREPKLRKD